MFDLEPEAITEGPLGRALAVLAVPIVAQNLVLVGQTLVDIFWLGRLPNGALAVAAVGLVAPLGGVLHVGSFVGYTGGQVVVSRYVGGDEETRANRAWFNATLFVAAVGVVVTAAVAAFARPIVGLFDPGTTVAGLAAGYLVIYAFATLVGGVSDVVEGAFHGWGDSTWPLRVNVLAILTNAVLDPFLIFGWGPFPALGVEGAAYATLVGYALGVVVALGVAFGGRSAFAPTRASLAGDVDLLREVVSVGAPKAGQELARQGARIVMVAIISFTGGAAALAAYTVGARIAAVAFVPAGAVGAAGTTLVGQNVGAARPDRAARATWLGVAVGGLGIGVVGAVQWTFPDEIARVFVPGIAGDELALTVAYLQILAVGYWALGAIKTVEAGFNGAGKTTVTMYATMLQYWAVRVPVAALLAYVVGMGALGPFWAVTASNVVAAVGLVGYFWHSERTGFLERAVEAAAD